MNTFAKDVEIACRIVRTAGQIALGYFRQRDRV